MLSRQFHRGVFMRVLKQFPLVVAMVFALVACDSSSGGSDNGELPELIAVASADPQQVTTEDFGIIITGLNGSEPYDALVAGDIDYSWEQTQGPTVTLDEAAGPTNYWFNPPPQAAVLEFELTLTDAEGNQDSDRVTVTVVEPGGVTANAGPNQTVMAGESVELDGSASFADENNIESYAWSQSDGTGVDYTIDNADQPIASFVASEPGEFRFQLNVITDDSVTDSDFVWITVLADLSGAERLMYFVAPEEDSAGENIKQLYAVDPTQANEDSIVPVTPVAQDNARARTDVEASFFRATGNFRDEIGAGVPWNSYEPDQTNLPLGVIDADFNNGALSNVSEYAVVYNTPEGRLYRASADGGTPESARISSESDAVVVCAAIVLNDYQNVENTRIAYQTPGDSAEDEGDCNHAVWRVVRLGDDATVAPNTFENFEDDHPLLGYNDFRTEFPLHWVVPVRGGNGSLQEILTYSGDVLTPGQGGSSGVVRRHDLDGSELDPGLLSANVDLFQPLGMAGNDLVLQINGNLFSYQYDFFFFALERGGSQETVNATATGPEHAVQVNDRLYVVDVVDADPETGRVLDIRPLGSPDQVFIRDSSWDTSLTIPMVTASDERIAWAYQPGSDSEERVIRSVDLTGPLAPQMLVNEEPVLFYFDAQSHTAPEGWVLFDLFDSSGGSTVRDEAGAISIVGAGDGEITPISGGQWLGQSWRRTVPQSGPEADYVFYFEDVGGSLRFKARRADENLSQGSIVDFNNQPAGGTVLGSGRWIAGYGPEILMGWRPLAGSSVYFVDPADADSLVDLTPAGTSPSPVPFH